MASSSTSSLRGGRSRKFKAEINVVPYIDVMMVLLVIFMVAAPLASPNVINLPTSGQSVLPPTQYIQVTLKPDGRSILTLSSKAGGKKRSENASNASDLAAKLAVWHKNEPDLPVLIEAEGKGKYEDVVKVISEAKRLGIIRVGLAVQAAK
ncbi:MAG: biopolymer transporter ExbD [Pseudomonadota bacterium]